MTPDMDLNKLAELLDLLKAKDVADFRNGDFYVSFATGERSFKQPLIDQPEDEDVRKSRIIAEAKAALKDQEELELYST